MSDINSSYLFERALGAIVYCSVVFLFFLLISLCKNYKNLKKIFIAYVICLSLMAFFYIPSDSVDVYRWYSLADEWVKMPFSDFLKYEVATSATPVAYLYIYLCCIAGIRGILSGVTALITYSCIFYMLFIIFKSRKVVDFKNISAIVFLTMCSGVFWSVIGGIRSCLAFSIVLACFFKETIKGRGYVIDLLFLLLACFIHTAAFVVVGVRYFALLIANKRIRSIIKVLIISSVTLIGVLFLKDYLFGAIDKFIHYYIEGVYFSGKAYISTLVIFFIESIVLLSFFSNKRIRAAVAFEQRIFIGCFLLLELVVLGNFVMLARFGIILLYLLPLPLISFLELKKNIMAIRGRPFIVLFSFLCLFLNYTCGDLSAYKFVVL